MKFDVNVDEYVMCTLKSGAQNFQRLDSEMNELVEIGKRLAQKCE